MAQYHYRHKVWHRYNKHPVGRFASRKEAEAYKQQHGDGATRIKRYRVYSAIPQESCKFCKRRVNEEDICCWCGGCMGLSCCDEGADIHVPCCECPERAEVAK